MGTHKFGKYSTAHILNSSFDEATQNLAAVGVLYDGTNLVYQMSPDMSLRLDDTTTTDVTYVGVASPGSAEGSAVWKIKKIDETTGLSITWADGNSNADNIWTNRASLTYS